MEDLVSVIIPLYNEKMYLREALDSICNQSYGNLEIIVIDSSTDIEIRNILADYKKSIRIISQEKCGVAMALNRGLECATGEYIARMDADDVAFPDRIRKQVDFLYEHPDVDVVGTQCWVIDGKGEVIEIRPTHERNSVIMANFIFGNPMWHPSLMFRRSLIDNGWRYDSSRLTEDYNLWIRMALKGVMFANIREPLMKYRTHGNNLSQTLHFKGEIDAVVSCRLFLESLLDISLENYGDYHFYRNGNKRYVEKIDAKFLCQQFELLYTIWYRNREKKAFEENSLVFELNRRWIEYANSAFGESIELFDGCNMCSMEAISRNIFFVEDLCIKYKVDINEYRKVCELFENIIYENYQIIIGMREKAINIVLYGLGKRGIETIHGIDEMRLQNKFKWNIVAISDAKEMQDINGYHYVKPQEITSVNFDFVIIATEKYYYEISNKLMQYGIPYNKILGIQWLNNNIL